MRRMRDRPESWNLGDIRVNRNRKGRLLRDSQQMDGNRIHASLKQDTRAVIDNSKDLRGPIPHARIFVFRMCARKGDKIPLTDR